MLSYDNIRQLLIAPPTYWSMDPTERNRRYEGCGPGKFGDYLVPDNFPILGCSFHVPCQIHDHMYDFQYPKTFCDDTFLKNMLICAGTAHLICRFWARHLAAIYYEAVRDFGQDAYDACKGESL